MMTERVSIEKKIFAELVALAESTGIEDVFLLTRPSISDSPMSQFIVINLPVPLSDIFDGNEEVSLRTTGVLYLYVRAKSNRTPNIVSQTDWLLKIKGLFPYVGDTIVCTDPAVLFEGYGDDGFHVTSVTFKLKTKYNSALTI